jgi:hypothetical protein
MFIPKQQNVSNLNQDVTKKNQAASRKQMVMSKTSELQNRLIDLLGLKEWENTRLG